MLGEISYLRLSPSLMFWENHGDMQCFLIEQKVWSSSLGILEGFSIEFYILDIVKSCTSMLEMEN